MSSTRTSIPPSTRIKVLVRDGHRCVYCGATRDTDKIEVDHVIPVSAGGTDDIGNLVAACFSCNRGKRDKMLLDIVPEDSGVFVKAAEPKAKSAAIVPKEAWEAERECVSLIGEWRRALSQWWRDVEVLPETVTSHFASESFLFAPTFRCSGRESSDLGEETLVLVTPWHEVGSFTPETQAQIRNAVIAGYQTPTMILMGPPEFFYGIAVTERYKGFPRGVVIDDLLQPLGEWENTGWYPDECLDFQDLREPFFSTPKAFSRRTFGLHGWYGVYSSVFEREDSANGF